jgi:uncharacterized repeat protein (TIGR03806 family)
LSDYHIFQGAPSDLVPSAEYTLYELSSTLFSDHAEKQRLIKLPPGTVLTAQGDGLPLFPNGTIIVKTFYYYYDKRDPTKGRKLLETRLMIKNEGGWNVATYLWDDAQREATLLTSGFNKMVNWIDETGRAQVISYHVPSNRECSTCHHSADAVVPIGPKLRNLNRPVHRNGQTVNQLDYFQQTGLLSPVRPATITALPNYADAALPLAERGRAYLEVNCAHCHNANGYAARTGLLMNFEQPFADTQIERRKDDIIDLVAAGRMPRLGTTVVDEPGLALLRAYINSL